MECIELGEKEKKILARLEVNARENCSQIAKNVGLSTETVRYKINRLVKEDVIDGFITFVNVNKLGLTYFGVYVQLQNTTEEKERKLIKYLCKHKNICWVAKLGGKYDLAFTILAKNIAEFDEILTDIMNRYEKYILNRDVSIRVEMFHNRRLYFTEERVYTEIPHFGKDIESVKLDDLDRKILSSISDDARLPVQEISKKLTVPASTIVLRIKNLIKNKIILGFTTLLNVRTFNFQEYDVLINFQNFTQDKEKSFLDFCRTHPFIIHGLKVVGKWDFELGVEVKNHNHYLQLLTELKDNFPDFIRSLEYVTVFKHHKFDSYPFKP